MYLRILFSTFLFIFICLFSVSFAHADTGAIYGASGGNVSLGKNETISMEDEQIIVDLFKDDYYHAHIEVHYTFKNTTSQNISVETGFPQIDSIAGNLKNFKVLVDGVETVTKDVKGILNEENGIWKVYTMNFAPNQTILVVNSYDNPSLGGYEGSKGKLQMFTYILETGNSWKGKIKKIDVLVKLRNIDIHEIGWLGGIDNALWKYNKDTNSLILFAKNLEPQVKDNINIGFDLKTKNNFSACNWKAQTIEDLLDERYSIASSTMQAIDTGMELINMGACTAFDGNSETSWVTQDVFDRINPFTISLFKPMNGFFDSLTIRTGRKNPSDVSSDNAYFARPKKIRVDFYRREDDKKYRIQSFYFDVPNTLEAITLPFPKKILSNLDSVTTTVLDVYLGTGSQNVAIAELQFNHLPLKIY